ncbi:MAG: hypothetical protein Ct9H300mP23_05830 [Nitrospinota bacterium]|nr:MAG: hypothetical protein Ct9H300mP23_05830 [Nitrospinota bacterium]
MFRHEGCGIKADQVHEAFLVGGSTRIPKAQELVKNYLVKTLIMELILTKLSLLGSSSSRGSFRRCERYFIVDVTPLSLGIETMGGVTTRLIDRKQPYRPKSRNIFYSS